MVDTQFLSNKEITYREILMIKNIMDLLNNNKKLAISRLKKWTVEEFKEDKRQRVDVISALTDSKIPRNYWSDLKRKLINEGSELHENIVQLKMRAKDGKFRETDALDTNGVLRLIEQLITIEIKDIQIK